MKRVLSWLLVLALTINVVGVAHAQPESPRAHPALLQLAQEQPNEKVKIIVQRKAQEQIPAHALERAGGKITKELPIINGFAMEVPARAIEALSRSRGVRWISIDAPVIPASTPGNSCNLVENAGFENGVAPWVDMNDTLDDQLSGNAHTGAFGLYLGSSGGTLSQIAQSATPGVTYTASAMVQRSGSGSSSAWMGIDFFDANWNEISDVDVWIPQSTSYIPVNTSGIAPTGTVHMTVWFWKDNDSTLYLDNISVQPTSPLAATCAGYSPEGGHNLLANPSFEAETTDWYVNHSGLQVTDNAYNGAKGIYLGQSSGTVAQSENVATAGVIYTARGMFQRPTGSPWSGIGIDFFDANWKEIGDVYRSIPETTAYAPTTVSGIAPEGTEHISVWIHKNSGGSLYIDDVSLVAGDVPNPYVQSIGADQLWYAPTPLNGQGVTVAVIDSGIADHSDLTQADNDTSRVIHSIDLTNGGTTNDINGHGTHVAGIIAGNGELSNGIHRGIAPAASLLNVRISNGQGMTYASDLVEGLQWVFDNKDTYNIRVINISLNSTVAESYHISPINAAVELLWFSGITVVVSAGNNGTANGASPLFPPANDPFVITVGAMSDRNTATLTDDFVESFSAYGTTIEGFTKPDLVAPGRNIISLNASNNSNLAQNHPAHKAGNYYFRMSGTSMAAPVVSGVVALLLQDEPNLTPDQIKYRLKATAATNWSGYDNAKAGAGYVNAYAAIHGTTTTSANTGIAASQMLWTGDDPVAWDSVSWNSVSWNSVSWNSVSWNSVSWNSVSWNSYVISSNLWDDIVDDRRLSAIETDGNTTVQSGGNILYLPLVAR